MPGRESVVRDQEKCRGFVPQKTAAELEAFEYFGYFPEDAEKYVESLLDPDGDSMVTHEHKSVPFDIIDDKASLDFKP